MVRFHSLRKSHLQVCKLLGFFIELRKALVSFIKSSHMAALVHGTTFLSLARFLWDFVIGTFIKICQENSSLVKIRLKCDALYMKTLVCLWNLTEFFSKWRTFHIEVLEKIKNISCQIYVVWNLHHLQDNDEKYIWIFEVMYYVWSINLTKINST